MKLNKKILNSSLVIMLALGLAGCATNATPNSHKTNEATSAKVVKQGNKKTAKNTKAKNDHQANKLATTTNTKQATGKSTSGVQTNSQSGSTTAASSTSSSATSRAKASLAAATNHSNHNSGTTTQASNSQSQSTLTATSTTKTATTTKATAKSNTPVHREVQLGLGDVASWTDSKGITHHVDSDGMDRETISGSSQVNYQDWSGKLPQNAVVTHNN
ncbi:hypothetical protein [Limosilactobacillus sp.]|uniref:hypothetical protein n=1 Tax=Limosilactobacillus sp. TaxID=2773925 RepID=UPI0035A01227